MDDNTFLITKVVGREILDSRGNPTVEAEVHLKTGIVGRAAVPSGASTGRFEALELRDNDQSRFQRKGVLKAVRNIIKLISPALKGLDCRDQRAIDYTMIKLDGTENKRRIGANAILGVSLAAAHSASKALRTPLYRYLGGVRSYKLPIPMMNIINGGKHAGNELALQEFLIMPLGTNSFREALRNGAEVYQTLRSILMKKFGPTAINIGDEGGYAPPLKKTCDALSVIIEAIEGAGYRPGRDIWVGIDAASSSFYDEKTCVYRVDGSELDKSGLTDYYKGLIRDYEVRSIEDPFYEGDFESFSNLTREVGSKVQIVGDDIFVTNIRRIQEGLKKHSANSLLLKVNQVGTLSEAVDAAELVSNHGWRVIVSHRSGETEDPFIADLAVGLRAAMIKTGAPARGERTAKYNQLLRIEEELGESAEFWGEMIGENY